MKTQGAFKLAGLVALVTVATSVVLLDLQHGYGQRKTAVVETKTALLQEMLERRLSDLPRPLGPLRPFEYTNRIVIDGQTFACRLAMADRRFEGKGLLAITENQDYLWIDNDNQAKLLTTNYLPRFFPPGF